MAEALTWLRGKNLKNFNESEAREWLDSVKSRQEPSCSVNYHYKIDLALTLANLAYKLGRSIRFDPVKEKIVGDPEAAGLAVPKYRAPWKFPAKYL